jgi:tetratricopeptide (TPR) repeat protein
MLRLFPVLILLFGPSASGGPPAPAREDARVFVHGGGVYARLPNQPPQGSPARSVPKAARDIYERAMKLSDAGKGQLAVAMLEEAIKLSPDYLDAHLALGSELAKMSRFDEATVAFERARRIDPQDERVYHSFGMLLMRQQKYVLAAAIFGEASRLSPSNPLHPLSRAVALIHHAHTIKASASERAAADRRYFLGIAEELLAKAAALGNGQLRADHLSMALFYELKGERARAADELEQFLRQSPRPQNEAAIRDAIEKLRRPIGEVNVPP